MHEELGHGAVMERVQKALISMLQSSIVVHVHLLYPFRVRDLTNQLAQKLVSLLVVSLAGRVKARS